ncbi:MAG: hypothetical protein QXY96_06590 [Candidatus Methanomethylicaceae archaeon]
MKMRIFFLLFILVIMVSSLNLIKGIGSTQYDNGCRIYIKNDTYVHPPTEFVTTAAYPDIVFLENDYIRVSLLPNRGLTLWGFFYKLKNEELLYIDPKPIAHRDEKGMLFLEFGGYYMLNPWNQRDYCQCVKEYKILSNRSDMVQVYTIAYEIQTDLKLEEIVTLRKENAKIEINVKITNAGKKDRTFRFYDRFVPLVNANTTIYIPTNKIKIGKSERNWMGAEGNFIEWPQAWSKLSEFKKYGFFFIENINYIGLIKNRIIFIKDWLSKNDSLITRFCYFADKYTEFNFKNSTSYIESIGREITLKPNESYEILLEFYVLPINKLDFLYRCLGGTMEIDKNNYTIGENMNLNLKLATSTEFKDIKAEIFFEKIEDKKAFKVLEEMIDRISPRELFEKTFSIKISEYSAGSYRAYVVFYDNLGNIIARSNEKIFSVKEKVQFIFTLLEILPTILVISIISLFIIVILYKKKEN